MQEHSLRLTIAFGSIAVSFLLGIQLLVELAPGSPSFGDGVDVGAMGRGWEFVWWLFTFFHSFYVYDFSLSLFFLSFFPSLLLLLG